MFKKHYEKLLAFMLTLILVIGCTGINTVHVSAASTTTVGNGKYSISNLTVQYEGTAKASATSVTIPDTITISGKTYKVTSVANNALKGNKKIKKLTIGNNVTKIGKNAFYGCKNLKNITINTTALTSKNVGAKSFKGLNSNAVVTVPSNKLDDYKTLLKSRGLTGGKQKVEGKKGEETNTTTENNYDPSQPLPEPQSYGFTIGNFSSENATFIDAHKITESSTYRFDNDIPFTASIYMNSMLYGDCKIEEIANPKSYAQCGHCKRYFLTDVLLGLHYEFTECHAGNYLIYPSATSMNGWTFYPDNSPCKVVYKFTLPDGLSYKEGSLEMKAMNRYDIASKNYHLECSGNQIIVTIDDIKSEPFYYPFNKAEYDKNPYAYKPLSEEEGSITPINVLFNVNLNANVNVVNTISGSITYYYKGNEKTIDLGNRTIYSSSVKINNTDTNGNPLQGGSFTLYAEEAVFTNGSSIGSYEWKKVKSDIKSGDVIYGIGQGTYKLVQDSAPNSYEQIFGKGSAEFSTSIKVKDGEVVIYGVDDRTFNDLEVNNGVINVNFQNKKK